MKYLLFLAFFPLSVSTSTCSFGQILVVSSSSCAPVPAGYYCDHTFGCYLKEIKICPVDNFCPPGSILPQTCIYGTNNKQGLGECVKVEVPQKSEDGTNNGENGRENSDEKLKEMKFYLVYAFVMSNISLFFLVLVFSVVVAKVRKDKKHEYVEVPTYDK